MVQGESEHQAIKDFFPLQEPKEPGAVEIKYYEVLEMIQDSKKTLDKTENLPILKDMTWDNLRSYGKELNDKHGVKIPLRASREIVEKAIEDLWQQLTT